jgi:hypothetical protein
MIRLGWKEKLHAFLGGRLLSVEYHAEEGYVTQHFEMGIYEAVEDVDRIIQGMYLYR